MALTRYKLGELIEQRREKFNGNENLPARGVCREGFISPKVDGADTSIYNVFYLNDFVFNPARMELNSIALNTEFDKAICSSLYEIFYIVRTDILLPEYLNLFIKRDEFARKCWFEAVGSARSYFRVFNLAEFNIDLPPLQIQQKYVDVYNSMLANQKSYERGLEDLKLTCDAYIEDLRRKYPCEEIGPYIDIVNESNVDKAVTYVQGVESSSSFMDTRANMEGVDISNYTIVRNGNIAYNPSRINLGSIALYDKENPCIVSPMYCVFKITNTDKIIPEYLMLWFSRTEFQRYTWFYGAGSVRDTFDFNLMKEVKIPLPSKEIQSSIVDIYNSYNERKSINEKLKSQIKSICPILIKGSIKEAMREA